MVWGAVCSVRVSGFPSDSGRASNCAHLIFRAESTYHLTVTP